MQNKKNKRKRQKSSLIKELDRLFSLIVRTKQPFCFCCGTKDNLTCGHLISRTVYSVRWDFDNARTQCIKCNLLHEYRPEIFTNLWIKENGLNKYQELIKKTQNKIKFKNSDLLKKIEDFSKILKEFE